MGAFEHLKTVGSGAAKNILADLEHRALGLADRARAPVAKKLDRDLASRIGHDDLN